MYQSNTIISSRRGLSSFERDALREYEEKEDAKKAKAEFDATPEGRLAARTEAAIRKASADKYAAEVAARRAAEAKVETEAQLRERASKALGGAATPKLVQMWMDSTREIEATGQTLAQHYRHRDPRTGARPD